MFTFASFHAVELTHQQLLYCTLFLAVVYKPNAFFLSFFQLQNQSSAQLSRVVKSVNSIFVLPLLPAFFSFLFSFLSDDILLSLFLSLSLSHTHSADLVVQIASHFASQQQQQE